MKILIVDDDFASRLLLQELLEPYGTVRIAMNGKRALAAVRFALDVGQPFDLVCVDIMMPEMDGHQALREMRGLEDACENGVRHRAIAFMTTAVDDEANVAEALHAKCDAYLLKPIDKTKLLEQMYACNLLPNPDVN